ncbi:light-mediated development protein DET1 [Nocardia sp. NPDC004260]
MDEREPITFVDAVTRDGSSEAERILLHSREGSKVYVRLADPCDSTPEPVPLYEGDELIVMEAISHISLHQTPEDSEGFLLSQRVAPIRREAATVYARPLKFGEADDGRRVHLCPGEQVVIEPQVELEYIDDWEGAGISGYVPLTPVLFTWMAIVPQSSEGRARYLLAAARRLDLAHTLFQRVDELRQSEPEGAPAVRRAVFELIGATELAFVSLGRAVDMCANAPTAIAATVPVPPEISSRCLAVNTIRNAYEHIEDRALGNVRGQPHPDATTIFNHDRVVRDGIIAYGSYQIDLATDVPELIAAARKYLKDVAGN